MDTIAEVSGSVDVLYDISGRQNNGLSLSAANRGVISAAVPHLNYNKTVLLDGFDDFYEFVLLDSIRTAFWVIYEDSNAVLRNQRVFLGESTSSFDFHRARILKFLEVQQTQK